MIVYLLNIGLLILWAIIFLYNKSISGGKRYFVILVSLQWILISGLRHISVGADTYTYSISFNNTRYRSWEQIFNNFYSMIFLGADGKDPGYAVFEKFVQLFTIDYQTYLVIIAVLFTVPLGIWIYKNSSDPFMSFLIYSCLFYAFFAITGHRQTIVTSLVALIGYKYIKERKFWLFFLLVLIAFTIHKSALVFCVFYFIANKTITERYIMMIITLLPLLFAFKNNYSHLLKVIGGYEVYGINPLAGTWTFTIIMFFILLIAIWKRKVIIKKKIQTTHFYNALFLAMIFLPLTFVNPSAMRVVQYFSIFLVFLIPEIINSFKAKEKVIVYYVAASLLILLFVKSNPHYLFFWQYTHLIT